MRFNPLVLSAVLLSGIQLIAAAENTSEKDPPNFFLQDPTDGQCLHGEKFQRCSIDTLFYVVGSPGAYEIHKRVPVGEEEDEDGICISKKSCAEKDQEKVNDVKLTKCTHCGAKNWNILGDNDSGYVLTEGEAGSKHQQCMTREKDGNKALTVPCSGPLADEMPYTPLQLQFATAADIVAMSSPAARLIGAASDGDKKKVQALVKDGVDVNSRDWDDLTAIIPAASNGFNDIVKVLLKEGADINAKDKDGVSALMEAAIMGHTKVMELLFKEGAEVDAKANSGVTALWLAAGEGKTDSIKLLLNKNADAAIQRDDGITALHSASMGGHADVVNLLLENGADPKAKDSDGLTPLMNAAENGNVDLLKALITNAGNEPDESGATYVDSFSETGFSALIIAAAKGHKEAVTYLLEAGAAVEATSGNGVTALMYAAASGMNDVINILIEKGGAAVNTEHSNGGTALLEAASGGNTDSMKLLIEKGAKFDFIDNDGVTPLMAVASQGDVDGQTLVIDALKKSMDPAKLAAHINLHSESGGTSVMFAAAGGHVECTKQLIENGANVNAIAKATPEYMVKYEKMVEDGTYPEEEPHVDGVTAVHVSAQAGHLECVKLLIENSADVTVADEEGRTPLVLAVKGNHGDVAVSIVAAGADPNTPYVDEDGVSHNLLMDAIQVENSEFASLLIEKGADLYFTDDKKVSTVLQASHRGLTDVVKQLLEKKTKDGFVDAPSDEGITPLIAAASEGHLEAVKLLIEAKAEVNAKDKDSTNAIMAACARGHLEAVEALLAAGADVNNQNADGHTALMFAYNGKNQVETLWERYSQYLTEGDKEEEGTEDGGTLQVIQDAMKNHSALVQLLLKSGADATLKDKEGHVAADFDFKPETDSEVLEQEAKAAKARDESKNEL
mmetsp:Transcript_12255/g.17096  ORF Transcript_12255/g.17096 Transcript_12255/m.17096 type:complete len:903 (+) Transcript_12255:62-2770(+)